MRWCCVYHPALDAYGVIPESALTIHRGAGWFRVGEYVTDQEFAVALPGAPVDLDAPEPTPEPEPEPKKSKVFIKEESI